MGNYERHVLTLGIVNDRHSFVEIDVLIASIQHRQHLGESVSILHIYGGFHRPVYDNPGHRTTLVDRTVPRVPALEMSVFEYFTHR